jgi:hypothetical protein
VIFLFSSYKQIRVSMIWRSTRPKCGLKHFFCFYTGYFFVICYAIHKNVP